VLCKFYLSDSVTS